MFEEPTNHLDEAECTAVFADLFPNGFAGPDVRDEIAPGGWEQSPLVPVFHPSARQVFEETLRIHRNIEALGRQKKETPPPPEPTFEEIAAEHRDTPIETEREVRELVGQCLWDIFSDNHEVLAPDGRIVDIGSFRAAGGFLADRLNEQSGDACYDYIDFYMGTAWISGRADLSSVYRMIFRRLKQRGLDWAYHFPKLYLVDFRPLQQALKEAEGEPEWANYSPEQALAKEQEQAERDREIEKMRRQLEEGHREAVAEALERPPPRTVQAYHAVFGDWPRGWPPSTD